MKPVLGYLGLGVAMMLGSAATGRADFIGHNMELSNGFPTPMFEAVLIPSGLQYVPPSDLYPSAISADLSGSNLLLFLMPPVVEAGGTTTFTLSDLTYSAQVITGVSIDPATSVPGFNSSDVSFNNENVFINFVGVISQGQDISLDFTFAGDPTPIVPEPLMIWVLVVVGAVLGWQSRFRKGLSVEGTIRRHRVKL